MSPVWKVQRSESPRCAALARAVSTILGETSMPTTLVPRAATARLTRPVPHPELKDGSAARACLLRVKLDVVREVRVDVVVDRGPVVVGKIEGHGFGGLHGREGSIILSAVPREAEERPVTAQSEGGESRD